MTITKITDVNEIAKKVAGYFNGIMEEEDFDTFQEMKDCYWWDSSDIKDEVEAVLKDYEWCITDDGSDVAPVIGDEYYSYRSFMAKVYKMVKR